MASSVVVQIGRFATAANASVITGGRESGAIVIRRRISVIRQTVDCCALETEIVGVVRANVTRDSSGISASPVRERIPRYARSTSRASSV